jgi:2-amino-4-hydroxy-6-hydroxymethyldihydropteridine diphosphokinase
MIYCYLGLGSNLAFPKRNLYKALQSLRAIPRSYVDKVSSIYLSLPYGPKAQPNFCNMVVGLSTQLSPLRLLHYCQAIEHKMGRIRKKHWGARIIDIDILIYGDLVFHNHRLTLPHPGIAHRDFVLVPLQEIAADITLPGGGKCKYFLADCEQNIILN